MNKYLISAILFLLVVGGLLVFGGSSSNINLAEKYGVKDITIYKSPNCGCCDIYAANMRNYGLNVDVVNKNDMDLIKEKYNVPSSLLSCHTSIIGEEVVEGHVPVEIISEAIEDDSVSHIALPGMPSGAPGMPGAKRGLFTIYSFDGENVEQFMEI